MHKRLLLIIAMAMVMAACSNQRRAGGGGGGAGGGGGQGDVAGGAQGQAGGPTDGGGAGAAEGGQGVGAGQAGGPGGGEGEGEREEEREEGGDDDLWPLDESGCTPGDLRCRGQELYYCLNDKAWEFFDDCEAKEQYCEDGKCQGCVPGEKRCLGQSVLVCEDDARTETTEEVCPDGNNCEEGRCVTGCGGGDDKFSNAGCEYWAVDLDNLNRRDEDGDGGALVAADGQFAVVVANVADADAHVDVYQSSGPGEDQEELIAQIDIRRGDIGVINLPPRSQVGPGIGYKAYRVVADQPVIAYQFNPLNNTVEAFSNDASLLIPSHTLGDEYRVVTGDGVIGGVLADNWGSFVTVVGTTEEPVEVTIEATENIDSMEGPGIDVNGRTVTATLERYQVLSVHTARPDGGGWVEGPNLSGTIVLATGPVAVFSGTVLTIVPSGPDGACCADHLEEMMWPVAAWGRTYVGARSLVRRRRNPEPDFWRLTGSQDGTELTYPAFTPDGAPRSLDAGESVQFKSTSHFAVQATAPIQLTQFLSSSAQVGGPMGPSYSTCRVVGPAGDEECLEREGYLSSCTEFDSGELACAPISDPSMVLTPPTEQFRDSYVFLAPEDYQIDFANIVAPAGTVVRLDDEVVRSWTDVAEMAGVTWMVATVELTDGRHTLTADAPIGLTVYGYDRDVSYGYPGGVNLQALEDRPPR